MKAFIPCVVVAILLSSCATVPKGHPRVLREWHESMRATPPPEKGCFQATHPSTEWREVTCGAAPKQPYLPRPRPEQVGNGNDVIGQASSGLLGAAEGSFLRTSTIGSGSSDTYSLQLNSQPFSTPACSGSPNANCLGWQQFVYSNNPAGGLLFVQYWLLNYTGGSTTCPSGWLASGNDCYSNSVNSSPVPFQPAANLPGMSLIGQGRSAGDTAILVLNDATDIHAFNADNVLDLSNGWTAVEFNVFGDGGGSQVTFGSGTSLGVSIIFDRPVNCTTGGFTAETNNLNAGPCTMTGNQLVFTQTFP